jgi:hypothetical protein
MHNVFLGTQWTIILGSPLKLDDELMTLAHLLDEDIHTIIQPKGC